MFPVDDQASMLWYSRHAVWSTPQRVSWLIATPYEAPRRERAIYIACVDRMIHVSSHEAP